MMFVIPDSFAKPLEPTLTFDDKIYTINDTLTLTGNTAIAGYVVSGHISNPDQIGVAFLGFMSDSDANFSHEIDLSTLGTFSTYQKYPERLINGTYTINIDNLGEFPTKERSYSFEFSHIVKSNHENIMLSLDKEIYGKKDLIIFTGTTPKEYFSSVFIMSVQDPYGKPVINRHNDSFLSFKMIVDKDGNFEARFFPKDFLINGQYKIVVDAPFTDKIIEKTFQYKNPDLVDIKILDSQVQKIDEAVIQIDTNVNQIDKDVKTLRTDVNSLQLQLDNFQKFVNEQFAIIFGLFNQTGT